MRNHHDYYPTPATTANDFFKKFIELEPRFDFTNAAVLDPSAGGCAVHEMSYPVALERLGCTNITSVDIRADSRATIKANYMEWYPTRHYDMVVTNPPYTIAIDYIVTALEDCVEDGFVVMLLRLNYFGSVGRRDFWQQHMPVYCVIHSQRPRFAGKSDLCEYAHFVWRKGEKPSFTKTYVV